MKMQKSWKRVRSGRPGRFGTKNLSYCENAKKLEEGPITASRKVWNQEFKLL